MLSQALSQYQIANIAYKMNFDPLKLEKDGFLEGHKESWYNYSGVNLTTGQEAAISFLDVLEYSPEFQDFYNQLATDGIEMPDGSVVGLKEFREFSESREFGSSLASFEQIALEFAVTRKLAGGTIEKFVNLLGGGPTGRVMRGLWNGVSKRKMTGTGPVGKAMTKLEAAILEEAGVITVRNVGVDAIADGHYMSPAWAIGGVTYRLSNEFVTAMMGAGGKLSKYGWYQDLLKSSNKINNKIIAPNLRRQGRQFVTGSFSGAMAMKAGDFTVELIHVAQGEMTFGDAVNNFVDGPSITHNAGLIAAMNVFTPRKTFINTLRNYKADAANFRGQKVVFNEAAKSLGGKNQNDFEYDSQGKALTYAEAQQKIIEAKDQQIEKIGGNPKAFENVNTRAKELGLNANQTMGIFGFLGKMKVKPGELKVEDFDNVFKDGEGKPLELNEFQQNALRKFVDAVNKSNLTNKQLFETFKIEHSANVLNAKNDAISFLSVYETGLSKQIEIADNISKKLSTTKGNSKYTVEEAELLNSMTQGVFENYCRENGLSEAEISNANNKFVGAKMAVQEANNLVLSRGPIRQRFIENQMELSDLDAQISKLDQQNKETKGASTYAKRNLQRLENRRAELLGEQETLDVYNEENLEKTFEVYSKQGAKGVPLLVFNTEKEMKAWVNEKDEDDYVNVTEAEAQSFNKGEGTISGFKTSTAKIISKEGALANKDVATVFHEDWHFSLDNIIGQQIREDAEFLSLDAQRQELLNQREDLQVKLASYKDPEGLAAQQTKQELSELDTEIAEVGAMQTTQVEVAKRQFIEDFKSMLRNSESPQIQEIYNKLEQNVMQHPEYRRNKSTDEWVTIFVEGLVKGEYDIAGMDFVQMKQLFGDMMGRSMGGKGIEDIEYLKDKDVSIEDPNYLKSQENFIKLLLDYSYEKRIQEEGSASEFVNKSAADQVQMALSSADYLKDGGAFSAKGIKELEKTITNLKDQKVSIQEEMKLMREELGIAGVKNNPAYDNLVSQVKFINEEISNGEANIETEKQTIKAKEDYDIARFDMDESLTSPSSGIPEEARNRYLDVIARLEKEENPTDRLRNEAKINELRDEKRKLEEQYTRTERTNLIELIKFY